MPDITADQALILPNATDNANGPLAFSNYNAGVEPRLVKRYASDADRLVRNPTPDDGELSYLLDTQQFYRYDNGGWLTVRASDSTPRAIVERSTAQSIPNNAVTAVTFDTALINDYSAPLFTLGAPTLLTLTVPGLYSIKGYAAFNVNGVGFRQIRIELNGTPVVIQSVANLGVAAGSEAHLNVTVDVYTNTTTDNVRMMLYQNSGGALSTSTIIRPRFSASRIG